MQINSHKQTGFTLVEVLITIAVVAVLIVIAVPAYTTYITKSRRSDGQSALLDMSNRMERYFTENNTYVGATPTALGVGTTSPSGHYTLSVPTATATTYTLQATPIGAQLQSDTQCGTLSYDYLGTKGSSAGTVANCW